MRAGLALGPLEGLRWAWRWVFRGPHAPFTGPARVLCAYGVLLGLLLVPTAVALWADPRTLDGVSVWLKPFKFLASVGLFSLTSALALQRVRSPQRHGALAWGWVGLLLVTATFELVYIGVQAGRGEASHFNTGDAFHAAMYSLMGLGAVLLTCTSGGLAWLVARHPRPGLAASEQLAWVLGLGLTVVLGVATGAVMSAQPGHFVGHPPGGDTVPVLGWSLVAGDYRVAHFLGIHAQQALPLVGALLAGTRRVTLGLGGATAVWVALTALALVQAVQGVPFFQWPA